MTNKIISSVITATAFVVMAITPTHPASLLFIFISSNKIVATIRLALALLMLGISFNLFNFSKFARKTVLYSGIGLISFGVICGLATSVIYAFYDYLKIMDVMIVLEAGIILCSAAVVSQPRQLSAKIQTKKAAKPRVALRQA